jgi:undecaprenyl-diphosphatase
MDGVMQSFIKSIRMPWLTALFRGITATGETVPVILATLILMILLMIYKKRKEALIFGFYMLGTWRLNDFLKEYLQRPRPDINLHLVETSGYSLPSGHSMNFMALVLLSLYFMWIFSANKKLNRRLTILMLLYGMLVGISRVYLNVHYFSDVITGWSIGVACAAAAVILHSYICKVKAKQ